MSKEMCKRSARRASELYESTFHLPEESLLPSTTRKRSGRSFGAMTNEGIGCLDRGRIGERRTIARYR